MKGARPETKVKCLPVDPDLYDFILIPIHLEQGKHWLLASIDVRERKMQLLDCSQKYSSRWRGQIHSILWVWLVASVRRLKAMGADIQEEPQWGIDTDHVNPLEVAELPGLRSLAGRNPLVESGFKKGAPSSARLLGGEGRSHLAVLNITVDKERPNGQKQWR